jgi:hypothetical protein
MHGKSKKLYMFVKFLIIHPKLNIKFTVEPEASEPGQHRVSTTAPLK